MNIVLIALDTQRADHLGCYGYDRNTSPFIDEIASRGVLFERCYAPNIPTHPSFTTMFSGKEAITHNIINISGGGVIQEGVRLLPEILQEQGYATTAVDSMGRHFTQGFDEYVSYEWDRSNPTVLRKAETVTEKALPVIERLAGQDKPFFLFIHYWDPHTPYLPPPEYTRKYYPEDGDPYDPDNHSLDEAWSWEPFKWYFHEWMPGITDAEYVNNLYDGETAYMDEQLRRVFDALAPIQEDTLVVLTADHGEILNEQLGYYDHHGLYEGNIHVPLILYQPGTMPEGRRVPGMVQNLDIAPTLLELLNLSDHDGMEGVSLAPSALGNGVETSPQTELYFSEATWQMKRAIRTDRWKLIDSIEPDPHGRPMQELFDLQADPEEQSNVIEQRPDVAKDLETRLRAWVQRRLVETGRDEDPIRAQGVAGTRIGTPKSGEIIGAGATPLHERAGGAAADIPKPEDLNAPNEAPDEAKGTKLHGYVKPQE